MSRAGSSEEQRIDALALARAGGRLAGRLELARLPRLEGVVAPREAEVAFELEGGHDERGRPMLTVRVSGSVPLVCQRTLEVFDHPYAAETAVLLAANEEQLVAWDEAEPEREVVLAASPLEVAALVEDELLLGLPMSPRKPGLGEEPLVAQAGPAGVDPEPDEGAFAALRSLRKR